MSVAANAFEWNVSAEEYHRDTSKIGHSMFETFVESQKDYCDFFVTGARPVPPPSGACRRCVYSAASLPAQATDCSIAAIRPRVSATVSGHPLVTHGG